MKEIDDEYSDYDDEGNPLNQKDIEKCKFLREKSMELLELTLYNNRHKIIKNIKKIEKETKANETIKANKAIKADKTDKTDKAIKAIKANKADIANLAITKKKATKKIGKITIEDNNTIGQLPIQE